jgi:regulatory protein
MKTIETVQKKTNYYLVVINNEEIQIDPEIYIKYHMRPGESFELKQYNEIITENILLINYKKAIKKLKKMMTTFEMKQYLEKEGVSEVIIKQIIFKLKSRKYLDDELYVKTYLSVKKGLLGPKKISYELKQKGIPFDIVDESVKSIDEHKDVHHLIQKKLASLRNKSNHQKKISLKTYLLSKGYSNAAIDSELNKLSLNQENDLENLKKDYEKLLYKLSGLKQDEKRQKITQKLYQKGYQIEDIKKIIQL